MASLRIGVGAWTFGDGIAQAIMSVLTAEGHLASVFDATAANVAYQPDVIFMWGPMGHLGPVMRTLEASIRSGRPALILWLTEQLPNPRYPEWWRRGVGLILARLEMRLYPIGRCNPGRSLEQSYLRQLLRFGSRYRYYGELYWLKQWQGRFVLGVTSQVTADFLRQRGFDPRIAYLGTASDWGTDLGLERDIPVLWLGKIATQRRRRILHRLRSDLRARGIPLMMVDGEEHPFVFGQERTRLLNRSKVMVNIMRQPWDDNSMRFYLAAPNGALVVTEPIAPHTPFTPGQHIVETRVESMADTIESCLKDDHRRSVITANARNLVLSKLTMENGIRDLIASL